MRRRLRSAERLRDRAISRGVFLAKTLPSKSSALLLLVTPADHLLDWRGLRRFEVVALVICKGLVGSQARRLKYCTALSCFSAFRIEQVLSCGTWANPRRSITEPIELSGTTTVFSPGSGGSNFCARESAACLRFVAPAVHHACGAVRNRAAAARGTAALLEPFFQHPTTRAAMLPAKPLENPHGTDHERHQDDG